MIVAVDIETQGLDSTKYLFGCLIIEGKENKPEIYYNKNKLWKRILTLAKALNKKGKTLNVYAHNAAYDFYGYANLKDKNLTWFCHKPFIVAYRMQKDGKQREAIKFLDTLAIFRMNLKKLGDMIKIPKIETPPELLDENKKLEFWELKQMEKYCIRDTEIVIESIKQMRDKLKKHDIHVKRIYTISQVAINYLINEWRKEKRFRHVFEDHKRGILIQTKHREKIHQAYRGGRVEAFITGKYSNVNYIDCNSLYPYAAKTMKFPDLRTERLINYPTKDNYKFILKKIGISKVMMRNRSNKIGILPIRTQIGNYFPKQGKIIIGTYTNEEITKALNEGYELIKIKWSVIYEQAENNPLRPFVEKLYKLRKETKEDFDNYFYKMMMNSAFGKLAQTRTGTEYVIDSVEKAGEYIKKNYEIMKGIDYDYMYKRDTPNQYMKKYYCPIIPTLINAKARLIMYDAYKQFKTLMYTDTDSIMFSEEIPKEIKLGDEMGEFKVEEMNENAMIYGRKTYSIGKHVKMSGFKVKEEDKPKFDEGIMESLQMQTMKTTADISKVGTFKKVTRHLNEQMFEHDKAMKLLNEQIVYIDCNTVDIKYFINEINKEL